MATLTLDSKTVNDILENMGLCLNFERIIKLIDPATKRLEDLRTKRLYIFIKDGHIRLENSAPDFKQVVHIAEVFNFNVFVYNYIPEEIAVRIERYYLKKYAEELLSFYGLKGVEISYKE